ncbi:MAG: helix-hairpin-helix domain-containing protein [Candidatus Krumholzibacteria bacterium]|nr:helix-hairpin-helix domain-containing protein [Candidatus Krumholzibacteria bacterium]MDH5268952.1 helix-hairpin-helix domain-containing protein [Candidatus Krumholzibacteria bacterium]
MRRVVGAGLLVILLGGDHIVRWVDDQRVPAARVAQPSAQQPSTAESQRRPAARPSLPYPAAYHDDPLHFLSTAPAESLALLPGIGPVLAGRIVGERAARGPFTSWTEVDRVSGVGPVTVRRLEAASRRR